MSIKDLPRHLRPREKLIEKGVTSLKDKELLAILFRIGTKKKNVIELSQEIIHKSAQKGLHNLDYAALTAIDGIDSSKACTLLAAFELSKRAFEHDSQKTTAIHTLSDSIIYLQTIRSLKKEHFVALYLDVRNNLIHQETISIGTLNVSIVHPREVFEPAIRHTAAGVIVAHNHPSGDPTPSDQDIKITKQLMEASKILAIDLVDHIIVTSERCISMREKGLLEAPP